MPSRFITKEMTSPPVLQAPKQCQLWRSGETMNEGVFSAWNGQGALSVRPTFCSWMYWPTISAGDIQA